MNYSNVVNTAAMLPGAMLAHWDSALVVAIIDEGFNMVERMLPGELVGNKISDIAIKGFRAVSEHYFLMNTLR
jgi:hypothetical protein